MTFIHVLVPVYNCEEWLVRNFEMLQGQTYKYHKVWIVDDASTDASPDIIEKYVKGNPHHWSWHRNEVNQKCPLNLWEGIQRMKAEPNDVIFLLDGDDFLPSRKVLDHVAMQFQDDYLWLAYGQYQAHPVNNGQIPAMDYPGPIYHKRRFRKSGLQLFNHPLMFRAHLWNALEESDLQDVNGNWFTIGYDKAIMLPMLEMATPDDGGSRHWKVLSKILYMYNAVNPESDCFKETNEHDLVNEIWTRPPKKAHYV